MLFQGYPLAALARFYDHVGQLFDFGCFANVVEDGEGFQILGHAARRGRSFWIYGVIQAEYLEGEKTEIKSATSAFLPLQIPFCIASSHSAWEKATESTMKIPGFQYFSCFSSSIWCHNVSEFLQVLAIWSSTLKQVRAWSLLWKRRSLNQHAHCIDMERSNGKVLICLQTGICCYRIFCFTSAPKEEESPSVQKHSSAFLLWLRFTKSTNATLQAPGLKLQLLLLRISCGEVSSAGALCHVGFICVVLCKGSMSGYPLMMHRYFWGCH